MGKLQFLADMNLSPLTVTQLRHQGWNIRRVSECMAETTSDIDILIYARTHELIIITQDLDFSSLLAIGGYEKPSVISLRVEQPRPAEITARVIDVLTTLEDELADGIIVSVDEHSIRYRTLPITT
jgi:predicted nuclease of predicted toxin-antitoxin system